MSAHGFWRTVGAARKVFAVDNARFRGKQAFAAGDHLDHNNPYHITRERNLHLAWRDGWQIAARQVSAQ